MGMLEGCMDHDTPEYTYEICFFDSATQKAKNGGSVSLGAWKGWTGKDLTQFSGKDLKYTEAKFEGGLGCWNGPDRSLTVTLECGVEKAVLAFSEPNKCEYAAKVSTPALCEADLEDEGVTEEIGVKRGVDHDEL
ncbi:glucosidase II beta subunit-like protein-domain-containing protein [Chytridium lagenaria]|nr:glucosidase II beta subunit-like protein-domain-containing protein [Chytridium lagenaria]